MIDRYKNRYLELLAEIIKEGIETGEFKPDINPQIAGSMFWAYIDGIGLYLEVIGDEYDHKEIFTQTEKMVLNYLCKNE